MCITQLNVNSGAAKERGSNYAPCYNVEQRVFVLWLQGEEREYFVKIRPRKQQTHKTFAGFDCISN